MTAIPLHAHEVRRLLIAGNVLVLRPIKPQPPWTTDEVYCEDGTWRFDGHADGHWYDTWPNDLGLRCPYGAPGSVAWVRETWFFAHAPNDESGQGYAISSDALGPVRWHPDLAPTRRGWCRTWHKRSPITMPRWASRCDVTVLDARVLRINELSQDDESMAGFTDDIPAYNHIHFQNDWLRRYARRFTDNLWQIWVWAVTVRRNAA